jgi:hypothetical protein
MTSLMHSNRLNFGERKWGEKYREGIELFGKDYNTLRNYKYYVAGRFELSVHADNLSWMHHAIAAPLDNFDEWPDRAVDESLYAFFDPFNGVFSLMARDSTVGVLRGLRHFRARGAEDARQCSPGSSPRETESGRPAL